MEKGKDLKDFFPLFPGDIVVRTAGKRELVGDINRVGGYCEDCNQNSAKDVVEVIRAAG